MSLLSPRCLYLLSGVFSPLIWTLPAIVADIGWAQIEFFSSDPSGLMIGFLAKRTF